MGEIDQLEIKVGHGAAGEALRESEEKFFKAFHAVPAILAISTLAEGRFVEVNETFLRVFGYRREEVIGRTSLELDIWETPEVRAGIIKTLRESGKVRDAEVKFRDKAGKLSVGIYSAEIVEINGELYLLSLQTDITARKRSEEALQRSETRYRAIVEAFDGLLYICSQDYRVEFMNDRLIQRTGYDATGELCYKVLHDLDAPCSWCLNYRVWRDETVRWEVRSPKDNRWYYMVNTPIHNPDGTMSKQAMIQDITERKLAEDAVRLNEARLEALLRLNEMTDASLHEITDFALEEAVRLTRSKIGYLAFVNEDETVLTLHAWSREAMAECRIADNMQQFSVAAKGLWGEVIRQRKPIITNDYSAPHPYKKGYPEGHVPVRRHLNAPIFDGRRIVAVAGVGNKEEDYDETDVRQLTLLIQGMWRLLLHKRTDEALKASEERYRRIVDTSQEGILVVDAEARLTYVNQRLAEMLGLDGAGMLGRPYLELIEDSRRGEVAERLGKRKEGMREQYEAVFLRGDGTKMWGSVSAAPIRGAHGEFCGSFAMISDISAWKRFEEEIEVLNTNLAARALELEIANEELEAFSYTVSHDLRKPLTAISGYSQLVLGLFGESLGNDCRDYLQEIVNSSDRMNQLIDTLLDFSRLTRREMHRETVDLSAMAQAIVAELRLADPQRRLSCTIAQGVVVNGDARLLRVVMDNLLGNAWKYSAKTEEAEIEFGVTEQRGKTAFFVRDNGVGFDMAHAHRLFAVFQRLHSADEFEGTGIGLATVYRIIQRHGGRVWAEGERGKGATFYFSL